MITDNPVARLSSIEVVHEYPGHRIEDNFISDGIQIVELPSSHDEFVSHADSILKSLDLPGMEERVPVLGYGANVNPARFAEKMAKYASQDTHTVLSVTPFESVVVKDVGVVWHGKQGQSGGIFAELYNRSTLPEQSEIESTISWMTKEQLAITHISEGATYQLTEITVFAGSDQRQVGAYAYTAGRSSILLKDGKPINVRRPGEIYADGMTAQQAIEFIVDSLPDNMPDGLSGVDSTDKLAELMKSQPSLAAKKRLQASAQNALRKQGKSKSYSFETDKGTRIGRADMNFVRGYKVLHLLEQDIELIRPSLDSIDAFASKHVSPGVELDVTIQGARETLDPAHKLRVRARVELQERFND